MSKLEFMLLSLELNPFAPKEVDSKDKYAAATWSLFGVTSDARSVYLSVNGALPLFYVQVPNSWGTYELGQFKAALKAAINKEKPGQWKGLARITPEWRGQFYGFTNAEKFQYYKLEFTSTFAFKTAKTCLDRPLPSSMGQLNLNLSQHKLPPEVQFLLDYKLGASNWIAVKDYRLLDLAQEASVDLAIACDVSDLSQIPEDSVAPLTIMSFDIECINYAFATGASPIDSLPDALIPENYAFCIAQTYLRFGQAEPYRQTIHYFGQCDPVAGVDTIVHQSEEEMLMGWREELLQEDPDFVTGYNINFDFNYLIDRANYHGLSEFIDLGKLRNIPKLPPRKQSQFGKLEKPSLPMVGRSIVDMMNIVKQEKKLRLYGLGVVSLEFLKETKHDLHPHQLWRNHLSGPADRHTNALYCVQDTALPMKLMLKFCTINNLIEMSRATKIPVDMVYQRGQQLRVLSLITEEANANGIIVGQPPRTTLMAPIRANDRHMPDGSFNYWVPLVQTDEKGYEGATVIDPRKGAYFEPVGTLDFNSLYPSIMISFWLCYITIVLELKYLGLNNVTYRCIELEQKGREPILLWWVTDRPALLPTVLQKVLAARGKAKKLLAEANGRKDKAMAQVYDGRQLSLKLVANSTYGFAGANLKGITPCLPISAGVTYYGRWMIATSKAFVEREYAPAEVLYGDSVSQDTPLLLRDPQGKIFLRKISDLFENGLDLGRKEICNSDLEVWSDKGFTPIRQVIRHKTDKPLYRITAEDGQVTVTEDHSLLDQKAKEIRPTDLSTQSQLLTSEWPGIHGSQSVGPERARQLGETIDDQGVPDQVWSWNRDDQAEYYEAAMVATNCLQGPISPLAKAGLYLLERSFGKPSPSQPGKVRKIERIGRTEEYVYDLETDNHHFAAGVGQLVVHNTDSIMIMWKRGTDQETFVKLFDLSKEAAKRITDYFRGHTLVDAVVLAFEKIYFPYLLYRKKGYAAIKYEHPNKGTKDVKGLAQIRRDSCEWVCETSDKVLDELFDMKDPSTVHQRVTQVVQGSLERLEKDQIPMEKLTLTKALSKRPYKTALPVHAAVAKKVADRDPALAYRSGDRVPFVVVDIGDPLGKRKVAEKGEDPEYAKAKKLKLDKVWYVENQLHNPIDSLLNLKGLFEDTDVLFAEPLRRMRNKQQNMKDLTHWFKPK